MSGSLKLEFAWEQFSRTSATARDVLQKAMEDVAEDALTVANRTIPLEMGIMQSSGVVRADEDTFEVGYYTDYAVIQHEDTTLQHDPGRRAKWLELTFQENENRWLLYIADRLQKGLEG